MPTTTTPPRPRPHPLLDPAHVSRRFAVAERMKLLGDSNRLAILETLARHGETNVTALTVALGTLQANTSAHIKLLRVTGLIEPRRDGKANYYRLTESGKDLWKRIGDLL